MKKQQIKISEKDVQNSILGWLSAKKIFHYRQNSGAFKTEAGGFYHFGTLGSPDIVAVIAGIYCGIECKGSTGRQSPAQKDFQERLEKMGGVYVLARSIDDVKKKFEHEGLI